jgi:WD40 repeat protein
MVACATKSNSIWFLELDGTRVNSFKVIRDAHSKDINCLNWNNNDTRLVSGGSDNLINIYCTKSAQLLLKLTQHKCMVFTAVYHPITGDIYSGGIDNWIGVWKENGSFVQLKAFIHRSIASTPRLLGI